MPASTSDLCAPREAWGRTYVNVHGLLKSLAKQRERRIYTTPSTSLSRT